MYVCIVHHENAKSRKKLFTNYQPVKETADHYISKALTTW